MISRHSGFTIIELMITIAIVAVLATIAAPSLRDLVKNSRMTSLANEFMTDLNVARGEAVKRGVRMAICPSSNGTSCTSSTGWKDGWVVFSDGGPGDGGVFGAVDAGLKNDPVTGFPLLDVIVKVGQKTDGTDVVITSVNAPAGPNGSYVGFRPSGIVEPGGSGAIEFHICDARSLANVSAAEANQKGRRITLSGSGRAGVTRCTCQNDGVTCN